MIRGQKRGRERDHQARGRNSRPQLEGLEARLLLYSTTGGAWQNPIRITYSIVPDGTSIGGTPSVLVSTLNSKFSTSSWASQFSQAAAIWEKVANINLVPVSDDGVALGSGPYQQGDPNHGDIRIAAIPLASNVLATTFLAPPIHGDDLAGDMVFNSTSNFKIGGDIDLLTTAVHEIGHALGMGHSQVTQAEMYAYYTGQKSGLTSDDIAGIQSIYGARQPDAYTAQLHNTTIGKSADLTPLIGQFASNQVAVSRLDLNTSSSVAWFKVTVPKNASQFAATIQSSNLSELSPSIQVMDASGNVVGYASSTSLGATATVNVPNAKAGQLYYIATFAATSGAGGAGGYGLLVNFSGNAIAPIAPAYTSILNQPDQGGGSTNQETDPNGPDVVSLGTLKGPGDSLGISPLGITSKPTTSTGSTAGLRADVPLWLDQLLMPLPPAVADSIETALASFYHSSNYSGSRLATVKGVDMASFIH